MTTEIVSVRGGADSYGYVFSFNVLHLFFASARFLVKYKKPSKVVTLLWSVIVAIFNMHELYYVIDCICTYIYHNHISNKCWIKYALVKAYVFKICYHYFSNHINSSLTFTNKYCITFYFFHQILNCPRIYRDCVLVYIAVYYSFLRREV